MPDQPAELSTKIHRLPFSWCSSCGSPFPDKDLDQWPRKCDICDNVLYRNPTPVLLALIPLVEGGVLTIRRGIEPEKGRLALVGGFMEWGEQWKVGVAREAREEIGSELNTEAITFYDCVTTPNGAQVLIVGLCEPLEMEAARQQLEQGDGEALEIHPIFSLGQLDFLEEANEMAFPLHNQVIRRFLKEIETGSATDPA